MSYRTHRNRVRFEDNIKFVPEPSLNSNYQGPRFPNLQSMFKQNSGQHYDTAGEATRAVAPMYTEDKTVNTNRMETASINKERTANTNPMEITSKNKEDVNTEAADFIKRRHHNLELQKLLSMKAAT